MIGLGGIAFAPVVIDPLCPSDALICTSRPFGAGLGMGTFCARDGVARQPAIEAPIKSASADRAMETDAFAIGGI